MKKVKIILAFHKPYNYIKNDIIFPVHVGRDIAFEESKDGIITNKDYKWLEENTTGDNTGDNISKKNRDYCELTATYWAWKNYEKLGNPDYIGLMHYRTYFNLIEYAKENKLETKDLCYNHETLGRLLNEYDGVIMEYWNFRKLVPECKDLNQVFKPHIDVINKSAPQLKDSLNLVLNSADIHYKNMFILKKEDFFEYCELLFSLLNCGRETGYWQNKRACGYVAEFLSSIIFDYLTLSKNRNLYGAPIFMLPENYNEIKFKNHMKYNFTLFKSKIFSSRKEHYQKKLTRLSPFTTINVNMSK